jgi:2-hydroxychromene-2-carboxylate isomerase
MIEFFFDCSSPWTYLAFHNIQPLAKEFGVDPTKFFAGIGEQAIKDQLKANTDEVMARGGFGSPTIFVDKTDMYFGNDRMSLIREALQRRKASAA